MAPTNPTGPQTGPPPAPVLSSGAFNPIQHAPSGFRNTPFLAARDRASSGPLLNAAPGRQVDNTSHSPGLRVSVNNTDGDDDDDGDDPHDDVDPDDEEEEEGSERLSALYITINTPFHIKGDGNLVAIEPSVTANQIALGIVSALRTMTVDGGGVPMIDEDGRPRRIKLNVSAGTSVDGSKNLVGERAVMERIAPTLKDKPSAAVTKIPMEQVDVPKKRDRSEVYGDELESKRSRQS